jgi:FixJ family two-component response regulator
MLDQGPTASPRLVAHFVAGGVRTVGLAPFVQARCAARNTWHVDSTRTTRESELLSSQSERMNPSVQPLVPHKEGGGVQTSQVAQDATVIVVDDDASVCKALRRLLESAGKRVATFSSPAELLDTPRSDKAGCFILDVSLPHMNGLELGNSLRAAGYWTPIIFITGLGDVPTSVRAMKSGAVDFLTKPVAESELLGAVDRALAHDAGARQAMAEMRELEQRLAMLTQREREVFALVVTGLLNKQIAARLGPSVKTVKVHRSRVMEKMQARSLAELVVMGQRLGFVTTADQQPRAAGILKA